MTKSRNALSKTDFCKTDGSYLFSGVSMNLNFVGTSD